MADIVFCRINRHSPSTVNKAWFLFQVNRILSFLVSFLLLSCSPPFFLCSDLFLFNKAKLISVFSINDCIVFLSINQWIHKCGQWSNTIDSSHSTVLLWDSFFLIIRSNQFAINIEQILVQIIIWVWLVDWNHCHLWLFNMWSLGHW